MWFNISLDFSNLSSEEQDQGWAGGTVALLTIVNTAEMDVLSRSGNVVSVKLVMVLSGDIVVSVLGLSLRLVVDNVLD